MACLIRPATSHTKGVLTLTTPERDQLIYRFPDIHQKLLALKQRYAIGLHHNWHDYSLRYDNLFDFHLAGLEDLKEQDGKLIPLVPMDACNFSPPCFRVGSTEKFWDILFVARAVAFKGIPEFFRAIRTLYDQGHRLRVLFICPVPPQKRDGVVHDVRKQYDALFNNAEQELFTLLTIDFRYPFPFDLETLAHYYRSSRIFVHSAPDERRCRVAAYAWASGLPVVGMAPVGSVLSPSLRQPPYFFETADYSDFPTRILDAIATSNAELNFDLARNEVASELSIETLNEHIDRIFSDSGWLPATRIGWHENLDIRLGRHHGLPAGVNRVDQDLGALFQYLLAINDVQMSRLLSAVDPEAKIAELSPCSPRAAAKGSMLWPMMIKRKLRSIIKLASG